MPLRNENLARFAGGELEIINPSARSILRGRIKHIARSNGDLLVHLIWEAYGDGLPPMGWRYGGCYTVHTIDCLKAHLTMSGDWINFRPHIDRRCITLRASNSPLLLDPVRVRDFRAEDLLEGESDHVFGWPNVDHL